MLNKYLDSIELVQGVEELTTRDLRPSCELLINVVYSLTKDSGHQ